MTKFKTFNRAVVILLSFTMSVFLFGGCNRNVSNYQNSAKNLTKENVNKDAIKKNYENALQTLVNDATITKDQANKVLTSLMANINNVGEQSIEKQNDNLNKLVRDGVITRQQADKIMDALKKIK